MSPLETNAITWSDHCDWKAFFPVISVFTLQAVPPRLHDRDYPVPVRYSEHLFLAPHDDLSDLIREVNRFPPRHTLIDGSNDNHLLTWN
jgi:hypothetical protein